MKECWTQMWILVDCSWFGLTGHQVLTVHQQSDTSSLSLCKCMTTFLPNSWVEMKMFAPLSLCIFYYTHPSAVSCSVGKWHWWWKARGHPVQNTTFSPALQMKHRSSLSWCHWFRKQKPVKVFYVYMCYWQLYAKVWAPLAELLTLFIFLNVKNTTPAANYFFFKSANINSQLLYICWT